MGQQNLLVLTLGALLVGVAVTGTLAAFQHHHRQATRDHLLTEGMDLAGQIAAWKTKPGLLGGGGGTQGLTVFTFDRLAGASTNAGGTRYRGASGVYKLVRTEGRDPVLVGRAYADASIRTRIVLTGLRTDCLVVQAVESSQETEGEVERPAGCTGF